MNLKTKWMVSSSLCASVIAVSLIAPNVLAQEMKIHTVSHGEYLQLIADKYGITVNNLIEWNHLDSNYIYTGDQLIVSAPGSNSTQVNEEVTETAQEIPASSSNTLNEETPISSQPTTNVTTYSNGNYHTVQSGDYLYKIAEEYGITVQNLKDWNNLSSNYIYSGDKLRVTPPGTSAPTPAPKPEKKPAPTSTPTPSTPQSGKVYVVQSGDYLYKIAEQYGITVQNLIDWNNLSSNYIFSGDRLIVSKPGAISPAPAPKPETQPAPQPAPTTTAKTYVVQTGDYLYKIAEANGVTVDDLKAWNKLTSNYIYSGDRLIVSKPVTPTPAPTPTPSPKPETQPTPTPAPTTTSKTYVVQTGDYLYKIAEANGVTVDDLKTWNKLTSNYIYTGDRLIVSKPVATTPAPSPAPKPETKPAPTPTPSPAPTTKIYVVQSGDYLYKIAEANGVTVDDLKTWNKLTSNYIYAGDRLIVSKPVVTTPAPTPTPKPETKPTPAPSTGPTPKTYVVEPGDSLYKISQAFGITIQELKEWNNLPDNYIYAGDVLVVSKVAGNPGTAPSIPVGSRSVFIDAGHGGWESGATFFGVKEKDLNLKIARQVADGLRALGYSVFETRTDDSYVDLRQRDDLPNELNTDIFVSIHHNAMPASMQGSARGILTLYHDRSVDEEGFMTPAGQTDAMLAQGRRLAESIQSNLVAATNAPSQGARPQNLHVTRTTNMPAALVELGFMDNPTEMQNLRNSVYQAKLVKGLINGITSYFGN